MARTPGWPDEPDGVHQEGKPGNEVACCLISVLLFFFGLMAWVWWGLTHAPPGFVL
ncbi:hypothetical protein [Streptomyces hundungensis]|uniref:hypothetical protein n=1 Tax=Streptomyces hundungensis TaxID=1077946 RepID=UPI0033C3CEC5